MYRTSIHPHIQYIECCSLASSLLLTRPQSFLTSSEIFNADEMALFWQILANKTLPLHLKGSTCHGKKKLARCVSKSCSLQMWIAHANSGHSLWLKADRHTVQECERPPCWICAPQESVNDISALPGLSSCRPGVLRMAFQGSVSVQNESKLNPYFDRFLLYNVDLTMPHPHFVGFLERPSQ